MNTDHLHSHIRSRISELCATLFRELILYVFAQVKTDRFHPIGVQMNICAATRYKTHYGQYCIRLLGMVSLNMINLYDAVNFGSCYVVYETLLITL